MTWQVAYGDDKGRRDFEIGAVLCHCRRQTATPNVQSAYVISQGKPQSHDGASLLALQSLSRFFGIACGADKWHLAIQLLFFLRFLVTKINSPRAALPSKNQGHFKPPFSTAAMSPIGV